MEDEIKDEPGSPCEDPEYCGGFCLGMCLKPREVEPSAPACDLENPEMCESCM